MIIGDVTPLPIERTSEHPMYKLLEIHMQRLGFLIPFREKINWDKPIERVELGEKETLSQLQKLAAKNDGVFLFMAKWFKKTVYHHLLLHPNTYGYYLPFRFDEPFIIEFKNEKYWFGSSIRLKEELGWLEMTMEKEKDQTVHDYWLQFKKLCDLSKETMTPFQIINE